MAALSARRARFYLDAYPRLLYQLDLLREAARRDDPNIAAIVLFGATVRLCPQPTTSANLLFLARDVSAFLAAPACPQTAPARLHGCAGVQLVRGLQRVPGDGWQLSGVVSDLEGKDLGLAMLGHIAQQGILVYADGQAVLPRPLRGLRDATGWGREVHELLSQCHAVLAEDRSVGHRKLPARQDERQASRSVVWDLDLGESIGPTSPA